MSNIQEPQENYLSGWIKLYRSIENKGWYQDSEYVHLWIHLLIKANHRGKEFMMNGEIIRLNPGQFVTGRKSLSVETSISESKIERILKLFEKERQIEQQTNSRNRVITIVSWDAYQKSEQQMDSGWTASGQRVDTNKNDNNEKNERIPFMVFWDLYNKKKAAKNCEAKWNKLDNKTREKIIQTLPAFLKSHPDKQFLPYPLTYINQQRWNDVIDDPRTEFEIRSEKSKNVAIGTHDKLFG